MRRLAALVIVPALALGALSGCAFTARGPAATEDRDIDTASTVVLETSGDLTIREGEPSLVITASQSVLDRLTSDVRDGELVLGVRAGTPPILLGEIRYELTLPSIERLEVNGSGDIDSDVPTADLEIEINGSADLDISSIDGSTVSLEISGSGDVDLSGRTDELAISIDGSADVDADDLDSQTVSVDLDGTGDIAVSASRTLDVSISGSGSVRYAGSPEVTEDISGSGEVSPKN
jgi:hypothetical protein